MKFNLIGDVSQVIDGAKELFCICEDGVTVSVTQKAGSDLIVTKNSIVFDRPCHFFRGLGLIAENLYRGNTDFEIKETPYFDMNGPMFDVSQGNAAFTVPVIKKILRQLALMGLDMFMLYSEDSLEVQNQPYFGYMRARYSEAEMKEIDDYAYMLGIEVIPCIQTLAHMPDPLHWNIYRPIKDYAECLLVGEDKTYEFLRDLILSASRPLRSKRIHIGMDEAYNLGRGHYLEKHGYREPIVIMKEHLERVMEILDELGLEPMMWGDMYFRHLGGAAECIGKPIPQNVKDAVPKGMSPVYWDYSDRSVEDYIKRIEVYKNLDAPTVYAGASWAWVGYSLSWSKTLKSTNNALTACKKAGIRQVMMTTWGDNGVEALMHINIAGCQLYAEHGYNETVDVNRLAERFEFCTGARLADFEALELLDRTPVVEGIEDPSHYNCSKYLMWQDILTGICDYNIRGFELDKHYEAVEKRLSAAVGNSGWYGGLFEYSAAAAHVLAKKSQMGLRLTEAYKAGNRAALENFAKVELPELIERFKNLRKVHMKNWFELYKPFGWDVMDMRYGSLITRINSAIEEIEMYLDGRLQKIEELEAERLEYINYGGKGGPVKYLNYFGDIVSPSRIAPKC